MKCLTDIEVIGGQVHPVPKLSLQNPLGFEKIVERLQDIENILGDTYDLDRLRELVEADKAGRCVFTKCKIGDTVFVVGKKKIVKARVQEIYLYNMPELIYLVDFECDNSCDGCPFDFWNQSWEGEWECGGECGDGSVKQSDFGKTVFLTEEAAKSALAKEADHE